MRIISISKGSLKASKSFYESLSKQFGFPVSNREHFKVSEQFPNEESTQYPILFFYTTSNNFFQQSYGRNLNLLATHNVLINFIFERNNSLIYQDCFLSSILLCLPYFFVSVFLSL